MARQLNLVAALLKLDDSTSHVPDSWRSELLRKHLDDETRTAVADVQSGPALVSARQRRRDLASAAVGRRISAHSAAPSQLARGPAHACCAGRQAMDAGHCAARGDSARRKQVADSHHSARPRRAVAISDAPARATGAALLRRPGTPRPAIAEPWSLLRRRRRGCFATAR